MLLFFLGYLFLFQRYSSFPIMQIWSLMTSSVAQGQWCDTILRISPPIIEAMLLKLDWDVAYYNIYQLVHILLMLLWQHARFQSPTSSIFNITIYDSKRHEIQLKMLKRRPNEGGTGICLRKDQLVCLVESL